MAIGSPRWWSAYPTVLLVLLVVSVSFLSRAAAGDDFAPEFRSVRQIATKQTTDSKKILFEVQGRNIRRGAQVRATTVAGEKGAECPEPGFRYEVVELWTHEFTRAKYELTVPKGAAGELFLCLPRRVRETGNGLETPIFNSEFFKWFSQGPEIRLNLTSGISFDHSTPTSFNEIRLKRAVPDNQFPADPIKRNIWISVLGHSENDNITKSSYICSKHFSKDDFVSKIGATDNARYLKRDAVSLRMHQVFEPKSATSMGIETDNQNGSVPAVYVSPRVMGLRVEHSSKSEIEDNGVPSLLANKDHVLRLFGEGFTRTMMVTFTHKKENCLLPVGSMFYVHNDSFSSHTALVTINIPAATSDEDSFYICTKEDRSDESTTFIHQGTDTWLQIKIFEKILPLWASIVVICTCLAFSSLFSGLNLGLMSMDKTELKILCNTGSSKERKYAQVIQPVRNHGNYLLCSILLGNVLVNSIFTILLDDLTSGLIAIIFSTLAIVVIGEITPQAVCSRHGLAIGAKTIWMTKIVMILTFPLAYPIAKLLDFALGEEIGNVYTRERLKELVKVTTGENDLDKDEVNIISGALELRKKTVLEVMTKIEDVFMLDYEAILDFETVSEIMKSGYSRIPVYDGNRQNIVTMLYIKDLAFVDPDDNTPLKTLCQFYQNPINFVFEDVTLDVMFRIFKEGNKGHMAFVHRVNNEGEGDPFYETIGLITLEDVIEELIQAEIMDETDVFTDNRTKRRRTAERRQDFTIFAEKRNETTKMMRISPQLTLAAYQYLSTSVEPFHPNVISETILRRLLKQDIIMHIKKNKEWRTDPANVIYDQGKAVDFFVIILEGRVEVTVGKENLIFEGGPFTYFGTQALVQTVGIESPSMAPSTMGSLESLNIDSMLRHTFVPDYTVRATTEVLYLKIKRSLYLAAKRATLMERSKKGDHQTEQQFDEELDKLLHSLDEEDGVSGGRQTPRRKSSRKSQEIKDNISSQTSPKTPSHYSSTSPPHRLSVRDINGSIKTSPVDDVQIGIKDEEISLLPRKS